LGKKIDLNRSNKSGSQLDLPEFSINRFTLSFKDEKLNKEFGDHLIIKSLNLVRGSIFLAAFLYALFDILDKVVIPDATEKVFVVRIISIFFFFVIIALTFTPLKKYLQFLMGLVVLLGGSGIIVMIIISESYGGQNYYAGILLAIIYAHSLLRLRFIYASMVTWVVVLIYALSTILLYVTPIHVFINNVFFLASANILGMFASYSLEYYMRTVFWQNRMLELKSNELEIEHKRKSDELEAARNIQLAMLPQVLPIMKNAEIAVKMETASEIGGDYYDFVFDNDIFRFVIGDATGHGANAGAMVTATKTIFSNYGSILDPTDFLQKANERVKQIQLPKLFMSLASGKLVNYKLEISGAGIPPLLIINKTKNTLEEFPLKGLPLGLNPNIPYSNMIIDLNKDDHLVFMTDGLPELFNSQNEMLGMERIKSRLLSSSFNGAESLLNLLLETANDWKGDHPLQDDVTLLVIKMK
jgi:hypothetical protein